MAGPSSTCRADSVWNCSSAAGMLASICAGTMPCDDTLLPDGSHRGGVGSVQRRIVGGQAGTKERVEQRRVNPGITGGSGSTRVELIGERRQCNCTRCPSRFCWPDR